MTLEEFIKAKIREEPKSCFKYLTITEQALRKAQRYARLVAEEYDDAECYGFLLGNSDERAIVTDVLLAPDQKVRRDSVDVSCEGILKAAEEIKKMGKKCLGVWHSHARFKPFHSHWDDENHEIVLGQLAPANYLTLEAEDVLLDGELNTALKDGKLTIIGSNGVLELTLKRGELRESIEIAKVKLTAKDFIAFAYSLVVSCGEKTYAEILIKRFGVSSVNDEMKRYEVKLNILSDDQEELLNEIKAKVTREKWTWGWGGWRDRDDDDEGEGRYGSQGHKGSKGWYSSDW